jgi:glutamate transport system substrate-binding protein
VADENVGEQQPGHRFNWRPVRLAAVVTVVVLVLVAIAYYLWWPTSPSESELKEQAGLTGRSDLLIGVKDDIPGVAYRNPNTGQYSGFDIDIAYLIAADLGFQQHEVRFLTIEDEDRNRGRARDGDRHVTVDLVIAHYSVTPKREEEPTVSFSDPYLATEQSVITRLGHLTVQHLRDLRGKKVCTVSTSTSETPAVQEGVDIIPRSNHGECLRGLRDGAFDAVTSDAAILAGFVAAEPEVFVHHDIGLDAQELWGVNTVGNEALRALVNLSLYRSRYDPGDRRWEDAYDRHLRPLERASVPQPVAIDEQLDVKEVDIRQWPWERVVAMDRSPLHPTERRRRAAFSGH